MKKKIIIIVICLLIILAIGGYFVYKHYEDNKFLEQNEWAEKYFVYLTGENDIPSEAKDTKIQFCETTQNEEPYMAITYNNGEDNTNIYYASNDGSVKKLENVLENTSLKLLYNKQKNKNLWYYYSNVNSKKYYIAVDFLVNSRKKYEKGEQISYNKDLIFDNAYGFNDDGSKLEENMKNYDELFEEPKDNKQETQVDVSSGKDKIKDAIIEAAKKYNEENKNSNNTETENANNEEIDIKEIYKKYIIEKKYAEETSDWESEVDEYAILDIDQDGTEELILKASNIDFYYILICGYNKDSQQVVTISDLGSTYVGIRYFEGDNKITYTTFRPFKDAMSYSFYKIENYQLVAIGSAGQDMGQYFIEEQGNRRNATEDEVRSQFDNAKYPEYQKISNLTNTGDKEEKQETKNTNTNTTQTANELKVGNYTLKYGTYVSEASSDLKITINANGTASQTWSGGIVTNYTYKIETYDFTQDPASGHIYETALVFYNSDGTQGGAYYPLSNTNLSSGDGPDYVYSGN